MIHTPDTATVFSSVLNLAFPVRHQPTTCGLPCGIKFNHAEFLSQRRASLLDDAPTTAKTAPVLAIDTYDNGALRRTNVPN